jgi:hypothetical protein
MAKEEAKPKDEKQPPVPPAKPVGPPPKRPWLASVIAIVIMIVGLLTVVIGGMLLGGAGLLFALPGFSIDPGIVALAGSLILLMGIVFLATGVGLWKLRKWALYLVALPLVLYLAMLGGSAAISGNPGIALVCAPVPIIAIVLLLYFISIRKRFS